MTATNIAALRRVNSGLNRAGLTITNLVGSMWTALAFTILAAVSLPAAIASGDPIIIVGWIAQTFLQLVLLPIIIVGQNQQAQRHDELAQKVDEVHTKVHGG